MNQILVFDAILGINLHFKLILSYVVSHNTLFKVANLWSCKQESLSYFVLGSMWKVWNKNLVLWRSMDLNRNIKKEPWDLEILYSIKAQTVLVEKRHYIIWNSNANIDFETTKLFGTHNMKWCIFHKSMSMLEQIVSKSSLNMEIFDLP